MHLTPTTGNSAVPFELELLVGATRYQKWLVDAVNPYLGKRVLELGSGIGNMSRHLPVADRLVLSEINPELVRILEERVPNQGGRSVALVDPAKPLAARFANEDFDTVLSFNVLEHIPDDVAMMRDLAELLRNSKAPGPKRIVSVVPAHQWAYGEVDKAFDHCRRYSAGSFRHLLRGAGITDLGRKHFRFRYLNLPGLLGWWFNGKLMGRSQIGYGNIRMFETLCPLIRPADDFLHKRLRLPFGNSLLAVYKL
ncbi:MAG: class I SAM-dependent methyltransferase [Bdellovibrionota bacterium]